MDIAKLKKTVSAYKSHLQRSINSLSEQLSKDERVRDNSLIKQYLQQVESKFERWESTMLKIQEDDDEDIDKNIESIDQTMDSVIKVTVQANQVLSKIKAEPEKHEHKADADSTKPHKVTDKMHLPKLEMKKFSGTNIEYYQEWYQIFMATIDKSSLSGVEKFIYLKMALEGEAMKLIEGYPVTEGNYALALGDLNEAYGDPDVVINHHVSKLLNLPSQTTPQSLRNLYTSISAHVRSLEALGVTSESYSIFLVPIVKSKLNDKLRKEVTRKKIKDITELLHELKEEVGTETSSNQVKLAFENEAPVKETRPPNRSNYKSWSNSPYQQPVTASAQSLNINTKTQYCIFCPGTQSHWVEDCNRVKHLKPHEVREMVIKENGCFCCFYKGHSIRDCRLRSRMKCNKCQSRNHNTYLHEEGRKGAYITVTTNPVEMSAVAPVENASTEKSATSPPSDNAVKTEVKGANAIHARQGRESTIMPIIRVRIKGNNGRKLELNAMLDQCSDQSFIRADVTKELQLDGPTIPMEVAGISGITDGRKDRKLVETKLYSTSFNHEVEVSLVEMPVICKPISRPSVPSDILNSRNLRNLQLADDYMKDEEKEIHILIGLDHYYNFITGRIKRASQQPVAIETVFGWMLVSDSQNQQMQSSSSITTMFISTEVERCLNQDLKKFWEVEESVIEKPVKPENKQAIQKFHKSVKYDPVTKKYTVSLPFINDDRNIASNYKVAEKQFYSLLKRFEAKPDLKYQYNEAMSEYINEGFAEQVPEDELYSTEPGIYYMPHRAVIKEENTTTKTRIVFNASSSGKNQVSLNDKLLIGPKLQPSIVEILMRWRCKPVALVADIRKMYSMIEVEENDRNSLRFLWLENNQIKHYRHTVLAFGLRSAPYLAIETVQSHIKKFIDIHPDVTESLLDSTYVDDYCNSEETVSNAMDTVTTASQIMTEAGMELRKWQSNEPEVMKHCKAISPSTDVTKDERKVLGMHWKSSEDYLYYIPKAPKQFPLKYISKRMIIGSAAKLHDPIGFISPVVIKAKMMIQQLWAAGVEWDENLVETQIAEEWMRWCEDLEAVKEIKINRKYVPVNTVIKHQQIHVFNDASEKGYATVAYLRSEDDKGKIYIALITSKTKVAPLKIITLPRLELMSALIGSRISLKIKDALKDESMKAYLWSDSRLTYGQTEVRWKTFVENRAQEIRENTDPVQWRHCPGKDNPADIASRGTTAVRLKESSLWWGGPSWLKEDEVHWPKRMNSLGTNNDALKEKRMKQYTCLVTDTTIQSNVIEPHKYSKLSTLLRKTAYVKRFVNNCRKKMQKKPLTLNKWPTAEEIDEALKCWLKSVQREYYPEEVDRLKAKSPIKQDSKISQLSPYIDEDTGLIRMEGRIHNAQLTESEKHPVILPHQSHIVKLLVENIHMKQMHSGVNHTLITLRNEFWVTRARSLVKSVVKSCILCRMHMPKRITVPYSPLPADRVTEASPFQIIGIDFTGPIHIEETKITTKRTTKKCPVKTVKVKTTSKAYIALTTCAVTRAVHLELVPDLSTDAFMRSFRRFVSRRGTSQVIYSDNAQTYKCAEKGIKQCYEILNSPKFQEFLSERSIKWKYICPLSPWWGGYWERLMKTIKIPLKKVLGKSFMSSDELYTVLTEVEAMVNSRPICAVHDDPNSLEYLTPANFLIGRSTINLPVRPLKHTEVHPTVTRKELNNLLRNQEKALKRVWKMWREEYLRSLGTSPAIKDQMPIKEGDLVMVASNLQPRCTWSVGRVSELLEGRDGRIRSAIVKVKGKLRTRPVQLMSKLEVADV